LVVINKEYPVVAPREASSVGNVYADHALLLREVVTEFVSLGCRRLLFCHDPGCCDANRLMQAAFLDETARHVEGGLAATTFVPGRGADAPARFRRLIEDGWNWDAVFIDGCAQADAFVREAERAGLRNGGDYILISTSCIEGERTRSGAEIAAYTQQPRRNGEAAWKMLYRMIEEGAAAAGQVRIPYLRASVNDSVGLEIVEKRGLGSERT
jgi:DNA-binding LacI/PurR family transcriptional regulator